MEYKMREDGTAGVPSSSYAQLRYVVIEGKGRE